MTGEQVVEVRRIVENEGWGVELPDWGRLAARLADVLAPPSEPVREPDKVRPPTVQEIEAAARHYYGDKYPDIAAFAISEAGAWLRAWLKVRDTEFAPPAAPVRDGALRTAAAVSDETEVLRRERDLAVREAGRRDQKWMDGIEAELGQKINWAAPFEEDSLRYLPSFSTVIRELRAAAQDASSLREAAAEYRRAVRDVEAGRRSPAGRVNRAHEALLRVALRAPEEE